jgi:hypothetical protein
MKNLAKLLIFVGIIVLVSRSEGCAPSGLQIWVATDPKHQEMLQYTLESAKLPCDTIYLFAKKSTINYDTHQLVQVEGRTYEVIARETINQ